MLKATALWNSQVSVAYYIYYWKIMKSHTGGHFCLHLTNLANFHAAQETTHETFTGVKTQNNVHKMHANENWNDQLTFLQMIFTHFN